MKSLLRILRTRHWHMGLGATLLVLTAAVAALGYWYFVVPTRFTVAVGPPGSVEAQDTSPSAVLAAIGGGPPPW